MNFEVHNQHTCMIEIQPTIHVHVHKITKYK